MNKKLLNHFSGSRSGNRKSKIQNLKWVGLLALVIAFAMCGAAGAQPTKVPGSHTSVLPPLPLTRPASRRSGRGCASLATWRGRTLSLSCDLRRESRIASPRLSPSLSVSRSTSLSRLARSVTRAAKEATTTIPIVMAQDGDPVGTGFVASLARPGGNITGLSTLAPELSGKRLEILKEIVPKLSRVAVIGSSTNPANAQTLKEVELAARGVQGAASST